MFLFFKSLAFLCCDLFNRFFSFRKDAKIAKKAVFYVLLNILCGLCVLGERRKTGTEL
jgi:uncharacterized membrane protein